MAKIMAHYSNDDIKNGNEGTGFLIGGLIPVGAGEVRLAYSTYKIDTVGADPRSNKLALGYVHNLSKRTALYTTFARVSNKNGAASIPERCSDCCKPQLDRLRLRYPSQLLISALAYASGRYKSKKAAFGRLFFCLFGGISCSGK